MILALKLFFRQFNNLYYKVLFSSIVLIFLLTFITYERETLTSYSGEIMGTTYKVIAKSQEEINLEQDIFKVLDKVNQEMSTYSSNSSISKINRSDLNKWVKVSKDFGNLAILSQKICMDTFGSFNISVGHLVNYYGFGPQRDLLDTDYVEEVDKFITEIKCNSYEVDLVNLKVRRLNEVYLDMSGIAKGFAIDKLSEFLESQSIESFLIELGGEVRTKGSKYKNEAWKVAIEDPTNKSLPLIILETSNYNNFSLATSGEYRNQRKVNDILLSHTIDPVTLKPIQKDHLSVSVISNNATEADALATALNVMGVIKGLEFANRNKLKVIYIYEEDESVSYKTSKFF